MPYYHITKCGGEISFWSRKCRKCGKKWPFMLLFSPVPPKDMKYLITPPVRGETHYAKWADKVPYAGDVASKLPNWPRWARILTAVVILGLCGGLIYAVTRLF